jgi:hypothetical protein
MAQQILFKASHSQSWSYQGLKHAYPVEHPKGNSDDSGRSQTR